MAPKKKPQKQNNNNKNANKKSNSSSSSSSTQKAKKLKAVYEKLFCAGFSYNQIELALSSLKDDATFEAALDSLCLNLPGNELPLKFSTGTSQHLNGGASVSVISVVRDWIPSDGSSANTDEEVQKISVRTKGHQGYDALDSRQHLKQIGSDNIWNNKKRLVDKAEELNYMEGFKVGKDNFEEVSRLDISLQVQGSPLTVVIPLKEEYESWEDYAIDKSSIKEVSKPRSYDVIAREYLEARLEATKAKEKRDKKSQEQAGDMICKLKQELSALGLLDNALASDFELEHFVEHTDESIVGGNKEFPLKPIPSGVSVQEKAEDNESGDVELGGFFSEDAPSSEALPTEIMKLQKKEKMRMLCSDKNIEKLDGIWKKGEPQKIPKAVLHQLCQRLG
ncbi:hypothetical protein Pint_32998 [Pistacia integerrima]|uniref:Uncharacterized protein n=1 Tax=Pistacia integerrima TaxID=434235 RepID=A0ACC0X886_9ROSI|nr:hypothetical protein Pint_32998 [Pistacia integerrima]